MKRARPNQVEGRSLAYALLCAALLLTSLPIHRSTWHGSRELHTLLETIATVLALITGAMALVRYYTRKSGTYLAPWQRLSGSGASRRLSRGCHLFIPLRDTRVPLSRLSSPGAGPLRTSSCPS